MSEYAFECVTELLSPPPECKNSPLMVTKIYVFTCEYVCIAVVDKSFCVWPLSKDITSQSDKAKPEIRM